MTRAEKYAFASLLQTASPDTAIEIGTYRGGSLQIISRAARKVYSVDISPSCRETLSADFPNVEFRTGPSREILPGVMKDIADSGESLGFVLIDGDHSAQGVRGDINLVLQHIPTRDVYIVFHDSFNPACRKGILSADWQACPYVHYVEVDYIPGVYHYDRFDTALPRSMWGGLALAVMKPEKRSGPLEIHESQKGLYKTILRGSNMSPGKHFAVFIDKLRRAFHR